MLLSAIITALGRFDIAKPGFQGSKEARYVLVPLIGWAWLFQSGFLHLAKQTVNTSKRALVLGFFSVFLIFMQIRLERWIRTHADFVANEQWASLGLENGLTDDALATAIFPSAGFVDHFLPVLKANHLSIFANDEVGWLGRNAGFLPQPRRIASGEVSRIWWIGSGLAVIVNTTDAAVQPGDILVFINQSHSIVGIGKRLPAGLPKRLATQGSLKHGWAGFINPGYGPVFSFTIVAFDRRNATTVQIGHSVAAPRRER